MQILYHFFSFICFFFNQNDANIPSKSNLLNPRFYRTQTALKPHLNRKHEKIEHYCHRRHLEGVSKASRRHLEIKSRVNAR